MRRPKAFETVEERDQRLQRETQAKRDHIAENDAAIDLMIRRNIEQHGA